MRIPAETVNKRPVIKAPTKLFRDSKYFKEKSNKTVRAENPTGTK